jgi:hypothetical protein
MIKGLFSGAVVLGFMLFLGNADAALIHGKDYQNPNGDQVVRVNSSGQVSPQTIAGERNTSSSTNSYLVVRPEANLSIISKTTAVTIGGGVANDTHLEGLHIHTALTGTCAITGFADSDGTAQTYTLPAASVGFRDFYGSINSAGALTITCSNASDDNLVAVFWRPR